MKKTRKEAEAEQHMRNSAAIQGIPYEEFKRQVEEFNALPEEEKRKPQRIR